MRISSGILAVSCLITSTAMAQAQQDQSQTGVTYTADSACLKRLTEAVPGFDNTLSESDQRDLRQLLRPALILARRGNEVACQAILTEIERIGAGAQQDQALTAQQRTEHIARARPVSPNEVLRMQDLLDADVVTREDEEVGDVEDFLFVPASQTPVYALVDRGGWLSLGSELVPVPLTSLRVTQGGELVIGGTAAQFEEAPAVEREGVSSSETAINADRYWADIDR